MEIKNMKEFTFVLTEDEANIVLHALQEMPARVANPLTKKLQEQAAEQIEPEETEESND